jgi:hypothetical protein
MASATNDLSYRDATSREATANILNYTDKRIGSIEIRVDIVRITFQDTAGATAVAIPTSYTNVFSLVTPTVVRQQTRGGSDWNTNTASSPTYIGDGSSCLITASLSLKPVTGVNTANTILLGVFKNNVLIATYGYTLAVPDYTNQRQTSNLFLTLTEPVSKNDVLSMQIRNSTAGSLNYNIYNAAFSVRPIELTVPKQS